MRSALAMVALATAAVSAIAQAPAGQPSSLSPPSGVARQGTAARSDRPYVVGAGAQGTPGSQPQQMPSPVVEFDLVQEVQDRVSPFSPSEVRRLRSELEERERAWYENLSKKPQPKAVVSEFRLDLSPGATPPIVRVTLGQGALVTFLSADAKPWPIKEADNFNAKGIRVTQLSAHVLSVSLISPYATGSVGVILDGLASGLTFTVVPAQAETDHRAEMIVPRVLALGETTAGDGGVASLSVPNFNTAELSKYLLKIPPETAKELKVEGSPDVTAWQSAKDRMIVRTALSIVSPAAYRRHSSADGTHVYELPITPVLTVQGPRAIYQTVVVRGIQVYGVASSKDSKEAAR